jgi:hypothetical protein
MRRFGWWVAASGVVLVLAVLSTLGWGALVVFGGALVAADIWVLRYASTREADPMAGIRSGLGICWLVAALFPVHNFFYRPNREAVSSIGVQPLIELLLFAGIAAVALHVVRRVEPTLSSARPPLAAFALPMWAVLSCLWSATGPYAFVRGAQMVVIAILGWATLALGRAAPTELERVLRIVVEGFVGTTLVLVSLGLVFGPIRVPTSAENLSRFTWIGAHPNGAGLVMAMAIVLLVTARHELLRLSWPARCFPIAGLAGAMYSNHSRTALACLIAALGLAALVTARRHAAFRFGGTPLLAALGVGAVLLQGEEAWNYVLRDRDTESLTTGNGRQELWAIGVDALTGPFDWVAGLGYGAARTIFIAELPWAVTAHNSLLSLLVSVGLIGVAALLVLVCLAVRDLCRSRCVPADQLLVGCVLVLVLANGVATDVLAEPNTGFVVVVLAAVYGRFGAEQWSEAGGDEDALAALAERRGAEPGGEIVGPGRAGRASRHLGEEPSRRPGSAQVVQPSAAQQRIDRDHHVAGVGRRVEAHDAQRDRGRQEIDQHRRHVRQ